ncbi:MAG: PhoH family protein [Cyclobacteriaceae bacterium]
MVEKAILLENIAPVEILGVENLNIKCLAKAFPESRIVSRGNEIRLLGKENDVVQMDHIIHSLINHYDTYGSVTDDKVQLYIDKSAEETKHPEGKILLHGTKGTAIKARSYNQEQIVKEAETKDLVFAIGPAGTGKTYVAVALAVRALKNKEVKKIIITRPAVEAGENLGFLPGDLTEKIDPYLRPIYDALSDMIPPDKLRLYKESNIVEIAPLAYMRGRTLENAFVLLDEAQNTTPNQMKMFLTRLGKRAKMIITGDITQIDLPGRQKSGLKEALDLLRDIKDIGVVRLDKADVVRHRLVKKIIEAYDKQ